MNYPIEENDEDWIEQNECSKIQDLIRDYFRRLKRPAPKFLDQMEKRAGKIDLGKTIEDQNWRLPEEVISCLKKKTFKFEHNIVVFKHGIKPSNEDFILRNYNNHFYVYTMINTTLVVADYGDKSMANFQRERIQQSTITCPNT